MRDKWVPKDKDEYSKHLFKQREARRKLKEKLKKSKEPRRSLTQVQRKEILKKTDGRCHICGGKLKDKWQADHILSHSKGGNNTTDNYLPAHRTCNNYRWDYTPEEFQEIMRLGIWVRTQIINQTSTGMVVADKFVKYEASRIKRRNHGK